MELLSPLHPEQGPGHNNLPPPAAGGTDLGVCLQREQPSPRVFFKKYSWPLHLQFGPRIF